MHSLQQLANLQGRTAIITGAAGHLGQTFAGTLAELGANLALVDKNDAVNKTALTIATEYKVKTWSVTGDLADSAFVASLPQQVVDATGSLDIIINNAGFVGTSNLDGWICDFDQQSINTWRDCLEVNLTAPIVLIQASLPFLRQSAGASIINIGSIYGLLGPDMRLYEGLNMGNPAAYAAGKGGLIQMTRYLATVLAPQVRVNCISPGGIWRNQDATFVKRYEDKTPLQRMGQEEDFKGAIAFLASDLSRYMTGQHLMIDGGWSTW